MLYAIRAWPNTINIGGVRLAPTDFEAYQKLHCHHQLKPSAASPRDASAGPKTRKRMGCAASTGPLYRDEHDFATTAAYYDKDDDVKKDCEGDARHAGTPPATPTRRRRRTSRTTGTTTAS